MLQLYLVVSSLALRTGLRTLLARVGFDVVGEGARLPVPLPADVDVVVISADVAEGEALHRLAAVDPALAVLYLYNEETASAVPFVARSGPALWGALPLEAPLDQLSAAINALSEEMVVVSPELFEGQTPPLGLWLRPNGAMSDDIPAPVESLTPRELEVLQLVAQGMPNKQIAQQLVISEHTVKFHISSIYGKLGSANRTEAVRIGVRQGLVSL